MLQTGTVFVLAMAYIAVLFLVASLADRHAAEKAGKRSNSTGRRDRPAIYALTLAVFCTSWTFFGSVGLVSRSGLEFLAVYIGPLIFVTVFHRLLKRIVLVAKSQRIGSVADFIGSRYGKSTPVAAVAALIAVIGTLPYISLQLKAVSDSVGYIVATASGGDSSADISAWIAIAMSVFAVLFGTRHADATEHQDGMMLAVAVESVVKLVAFMAVGIFAVYGIFGGMTELLAAAAATGVNVEQVTNVASWPRLFILSLLSLSVFLLLPRIFHVAIVENRSDRELRSAMGLFPLYLVAINLFVIPIALAGPTLFGGAVDADLFVLAIPLSMGEPGLALLAFIGGLSAATAMVIVATVALSIMISNDLVLPFLLRHRSRSRRNSGLSNDTMDAQPNFDRNMVARILTIRRASIFVVMLLAFIYYRSAGNAALAAIGLMSFAALVQIAPAFFGGLVWRRATSRGAISGMAVGFGVWAYTLLLPTLLPSESSLLAQGPFGLGFLRPQGLFGLNMDPLMHGIIVSVIANIAAFVVASQTRPQNYLERVQSSVFIPRSTSSLKVLHAGAPVSVSDVRNTVARFLGYERTNRSLGTFLHGHAAPLHDKDPASPELLEFAEQLLASAIGASSSRLVLSLMLQRHEQVGEETVQLLNDASVAIQYNRDLLQTALDKVEQGLTVFDRSRRLVCWNNNYRQLLDLPPKLGEVGMELSAFYDELHDRGDLVGITFPTFRDRLLKARQPWQLKLRRSGRIFEIVSNEMPDGGVVTTWSDISQSEAAAEELRTAKADLERRVEERTAELTRLNLELNRARERADDANASKTRFLAAAGHDILQPLNAARLYTAFLNEKTDDKELTNTAENLSTSLDAVEDILGAVLAISRLDAGHWKPELRTVALQSIFDELKTQFEPVAADRGLRFSVVPTSARVRADRGLLKRLVQNLVSNALNYTQHGGVVLGVRRGTDDMGAVTADITVCDTGMGIAADDRERIFDEFRRLPESRTTTEGLGLGLSIVQRVADVLGADVELESELDRGSTFRVRLPALAPAKVSGTSAGQAVSDDHPPQRPSARLGSLVLCIDNEQSILDGMSNLMSNWGCHVITARNLSEARFEIHRAGAQPDIIFADFHLDETDGLSVVHSLREDAGHTIPAALVTADRSPDTKARAVALGLSVLNKPVKPAALRALLTRTKPVTQAAE
ncbi:MAG: PAS domain-containing hybrid sensor histidine kinase/response regulator [Pseudomonadota bacterium]